MCSYYITSSVICQEVFSSFLNFFQPLGLGCSPHCSYIVSHLGAFVKRFFNFFFRSARSVLRRCSPSLLLNCTTSHRKLQVVMLHKLRDFTNKFFVQNFLLTNCWRYGIMEFLPGHNCDRAAKISMEKARVIPRFPHTLSALRHCTQWQSLLHATAP